MTELNNEDIIDEPIDGEAEALDGEETPMIDEPIDDEEPSVIEDDVPFEEEEVIADPVDEEEEVIDPPVEEPAEEEEVPPVTVEDPIEEEDTPPDTVEESVLPEDETIEPKPPVEIDTVPEVTEEQQLCIDIGAHLGEVIGWSMKECKAYVKNGKKPKRTARGNYVSDSSRLSRVTRWSENEILDFAEGLFKFTPEEEVEVWKTIYTMYGVPGSTSIESVKQYLLNAVPFAYTSRGVLIDDVTRDQRPLSQWTYKEITASLRGEITTTNKYEDVLARFLDYTGLSYSTEDERLEEILEEDNLITTGDFVITAKLEEYKRARIGAMRPDPKRVGDSHANFYRVIKKLLTTDFTEFNEGWNLVLKFFKEEENRMFAMRSRFLHWDHVPLKRGDLASAENLITLLCMTCDPLARNEGLSEESILALSEGLGTEEEIQKIVAYYAK